ncbi:MAG: hypothetical protein HYX37_01690 [Rhizobiales bacterium]|nr:hypothetical protein [Hyphomicrobiales bacterium]
MLAIGRATAAGSIAARVTQLAGYAGRGHAAAMLDHAGDRARDAPARSPRTWHSSQDMPSADPWPRCSITLATGRAMHRLDRRWLCAADHDHRKHVSFRRDLALAGLDRGDDHARTVSRWLWTVDRGHGKAVSRESRAEYLDIASGAYSGSSGKCCPWAAFAAR